ncbi:MAG: hypothetical protein WAL85_06440 [Candidatus Korobacteraceae bacterium]
MRNKKFSIGLRVLAIFALTLLVTSTWAATNWREKVLYSFNGGGGDGSWPSGLIFDAASNLSHPCRRQLATGRERSELSILRYVQVQAVNHFKVPAVSGN